MPAQYRVAVIGSTGRGDYGHAIDTCWLDHPQAEIIAVADDNPEGLKKAAERLKVKTTYSDYKEMLAKEKPQIVAVCPRWLDQHRDIALACAGAGSHVLMEKPFARTLEEADQIVEAFERKHLKLALAHQARYSPTVEMAKKLIDQGEIGTVLELRGRGKEDARGGCEDLWVLGCHVFDMMRFLVGDPTHCFGRMLQGGNPVTRKDIRPGNEGLGPMGGDRVDAMLQFPKGICGYFSSQQRADGKPSRFGLMVYGSKGVIEIENGFMKSVKLLPDSSWSPGRSKQAWVPVSSQGISKPETAKPDPYNGNTLIVNNLIESIEQDKQPTESMYDGRWTIEMIMGLFESHRLGSSVELPLKNRKQHPLEQLA